MVALGGGAVLSERDARRLLARRAFTVLLDDRPRDRVGSGAAAPAARWRSTTRRSTRSTASGCRVYEEVADAHARARRGRGRARRRRRSTSARGARPARRARARRRARSRSSPTRTSPGIHGVTAQLALGDRDVALHEVPAGEAAKAIAVLERLWRALRIGRDGGIVGARRRLHDRPRRVRRRDVHAGRRRGWRCRRRSSARSTRRSAARPRSTSRAARTWSARSTGRARVVIDPGTLETLPEARAPERDGRGREDGAADGRAASGSSRSPSSCAAARRSRPPSASPDPHDRGPRNQLNLGHTFAHALEAAAGYDLPHGQAVALGMVAALRLSGNDAALAAVRDAARPAAGQGRPRRSPGRRSRATRRRSAARRGSCCSSATASRRWGNERPGGRRSAPRSTT